MSNHDMRVKGGAFGLFALVLVSAMGAGAFFRGQEWPQAAALAGLAVVLAALVGRVLTARRVYDEAPAWERVRLEIERARRHNGSLVVVRLPLTSDSPSTARTLSERAGVVLRGGDAAWVEGRSIFVLLADANQQTALSGINRVLGGFDGEIAGPPLVASFPDDVITLGGLIDRLHPARPAGRRRPKDAVRAAASLVVEPDSKASA